MDFITSIVSGVIVKIAETTVVPLYRQVGYVIHYKSNLQNLRDQVENLVCAKDRRQHTLDDEVKRKGKRVERDVENWLTKVDEITQEVDIFLEDERHAKTKCFHGFCPNPILRYQLSRKSTKLVQKVEFHEKREFTTLSYSVPPQDICNIQSRDYLAFESRLSIVKDIMEKLRNPDTNMIGVYGIGGVGKTTLAKEVYRQATEQKLFDDVIIVLDVKLIPDLEGIQKQILEKLGMKVVDGQSIAIRASLLWDRIKDKKVLIILDDVPERIYLETMGVLNEPNCNLMFTARDRRVLCSEMRTQEDFRLDALGEIETWNLFEKVAGDIVKENPIRTVAKEVAKKCGGLPILVVAVASALRVGTLHEWKDALRKLKKFDMKELAEKAWLTLEWSYNQLDAEELKPLFLLCGIFAWGNYSMDLNDCFKYSMGLGLLKKVDTMEEAQAAFHSLIKKLQNYCLLPDQQAVIDNTFVRMHELVRNVAVMIARRDQHVLVRESTELFKEWPNKAFIEKCTMIFLRLSNVPRLPEVPSQCQELKLFALESRDQSLQIGSNFFKDMKELKVLDLSGFPVPSLPASLQFLTNLQTLCLDRCVLGDIALVGQLRSLKILSLLKSKLTQLPEEIGQLTNLQLLDLTGCSKLVLIPPNVIASLKSLEDLRMGGNSFKQWEAEGIVGSKRRTNSSLSELKQLSKLTALDIHIPDARVLPSGLLLHLERYHVFIGEEWKWLSFDNSFNTLKLKLATSNQLDGGLEMLVKKSEHLYLDVMEGVNDIFHLLNSDGYQQLKHLQVQNNAEITYVINHNVFQKLQSLTLMNLPKLVSFSSNSRTVVAITTTNEQLKTDGECKEIILENEIESPVQLFKNGEIVMPNLTILIVHKCDGLRFLLSSSMAKSLVQLKHLEVHNCQIMEEIISTKESGEEMTTKDIFCKLNHLQLQHLPQLTRFCVGNYIEFPSLEILHLEDCTKLETFIFDHAMIKSAETDSKDNLETPGPYFLFDDKVGFPSLERLVIYDLPKLITVWHNQLSQDSFCRLRKVDVGRCHNLINIFAASIMGRLNALDTLQIRNCKSIQGVFELEGINVERHDDPSTTQMRMSYCQNLDLIEIDSCESLKNILPVSVAKGLEQLRKLSVTNCDGVEAIVAKEGQETTPNFVFPKATSVTFYYLPKIKCFYNGRHTSKWPLLKELWVNGCRNVDIFGSEFSRFQENLGSTQPFFLIEKDSFPNLEYLTLGGTEMEIWDGPLPAELFTKLKHLDIASSHFKSSDAFLQKLHNQLEILQVNESLLEEIFVDQGNGSGEIHAVVTLPHLTSLKLSEMNMLMHLGKENSQPIIPNLEILEVSLCGKLKNLSSPAISFQNLKTLKAIGCQGLEYLITSSIAQSLMQLTHLEVKDCEGLVQIVGSSSEDEAGNEIAFNRLEHLELSGLPSLQRFFSANMLSHQFTICDEIEESGDTKENLDGAVQYFLFDKKVGFPSLERLVIYDLPKLITIWHNQLPQDSFCRLRKVDVQRCHNLINIFAASIMGRLNALDTLQIRNCKSIQGVFELEGINVERHDDPSTTQMRMSYCQNLDLIEIDSCESLKNILPVSVAKGLEQLRKLSVTNCDGVEAIVAKEGQETTPNFVFPKATSVTFYYLPKIKCFYNGRHTSKWPLLKELWVNGCRNVDIFGSEFSRFQENLGSTQPFFLIEKDSFPNLEYLTLGGTEMEIWDGPLPAELFTKLKHLDIASSHFKSSDAFLQKLHNQLEILQVNESLLEEIFVDQGNGSGEIHAVVTLPHLTSLKLSEMNMLMHLGKENSQPIIPNLEILEVSLCGKLKNLSSPAISFQNLKTLKAIGCQGLEYLITSSIAQSLMQLTHLEVKDCEGLVQIVGSSSEDEAGNEIAFNRLEHLELSGLPSLQRFFSANMLSHQFTICDEIEESGDMKENLNSAVQYILFDKKVGLPRLETLIVHDLHKLMTIWHEQLAPDSFCRLKTVDVQRCSSLINIFGASILGRLNVLDALKLRQCQSLRLVFEHGGINAEEEDDTSITPSKLPEYCQNLVSVEIDSCESLRNIFPASVARGLQQLRKLSVKNCVRVEEIVAMEGLGMTTPEFVFPNATSVIFQNLPRLSSFYPGMHASVWPLLKELRVKFCDNVEIFAVGLVGTAIRQPLFLIEKGSFSNLELLHFYSKVGAMKNWWSLLPAEFFSKLKSLWSQSGVFQSGFLQYLPHLEDLVLYGFEKEVFVHEGISSGEIQAVGTLLPHLKRLTLYIMPELIHLGKENSQLVIPNLEFLRVTLCGKLKNLTSPAVSFQNLKTLKVRSCHGLEYLTTYSIAQSLTQLTHMEVKDCQELTEIVASSNQDDDAVNEIAFMRLQRLELSGLPSLRRFCSGNCLVKIPSLGILTVTECLIDMKISPDQVLLSNSKPERLKLIEEEAEYHDKSEGSGTTRTQAT
ncbi:uncharacterized protein LOC133732843 [Rosa rugosa]|uniref:uncharacterized protein LOC133732843 n=1 Tax=Rosa rugosa TaxID=74645 RepID=UPI002B401D82|nr:uncharacterized protein LOC133732843 [Rosa rugosa]